MLTSNFAINAKPDLDERTKSFPVTKGGTLVVSIDPGEIEITTWDKNEVQILARGIDEEDIDNLQTRISGNKVTVKYDSRWGWSQNVNLIISAPKDFNYELNTSSGSISFIGRVTGLMDLVTMSGEVKLNDVKGDVYVKTYGGEIRTGNLNGKIDLSTQGGEIIVGNIITGPSNIETMGGDIRLRDVGGDLKMKTYGGDIEIGNIGGNANVTTYGGDIKVDKVGGDATLDTYGGDIRLRGATGSIDVSTAGGDITLFNITGRVDAKTSAGDIYVELNPSGKGRSRIETAMGNIELVIPKESKVSIEAEITVQGYGRNREENFKINSDFKETTYDSDRRNREIFATYEINGGGEKIYLKTVNSDIDIKKARK